MGSIQLCTPKMLAKVKMLPLSAAKKVGSTERNLKRSTGLFASATWIGVSHNWPQLTLTKIRQMTECFFVVHSDSIRDSTLLYSISFQIQIQIHNFEVSLVLTGGNQKNRFQIPTPSLNHLATNVVHNQRKSVCLHAFAMAHCGKILLKVCITNVVKYLL